MILDISLDTRSNFNKENKRFGDEGMLRKTIKCFPDILSLFILIQNGVLLFFNFYFFNSNGVGSVNK